MKPGKLVIFFVIACLAAAGTHAAIAKSPKPSVQWIPFYWQGDSISGKYIEKAYLYVPVKIEDLPYNFSMQLDLGTPNTQFYGNPLKPYLEASPALASKLGDFIFGGVDLRMGPVDYPSDIWHRANFGEAIPADSLYTETPKHIGTIAPDIFQDKVLVIDYPSCRFAITDDLPAEYKKLPAVEFEVENGIIKLPFLIEGQQYKLMFDTGSSPFPLATSKERAQAISDGEIIDSLSGPLWWGQEITFYGLEVNKPVELSGQALKNGRVYYDKEGLWEEIFNSLDIWGLTGNAYFFDYVVILDYKNKLFYIK